MSEKSFFATFLVFSLSLSCLFADGKVNTRKDRMVELDNMIVAENVMSLSQIDKLIKDTNYDKALEELNKYINVYPENFDNAQIRISRIMSARNKYSELAEELVQVVLEEPDNSEKIYRITYELEHLEKYPTDQQLAFIKDIALAAEFAYFRKEFVRINEESDELMQKDSYVAAANKLHEGFSLYQERFYEDVTDTVILESVEEALSKVEDTLVSYEQVQLGFEETVGEFVKAVEREDESEINLAKKKVDEYFVRLADIRNEIYAAGNVFTENFEELKARSERELTDASYLPFVSRFTMGSADSSYSGIAGIMNFQWEKNILTMKNAVDEKINKYVAQVKDSFPEKIMESSVQRLDTGALVRLGDFSSLAVSVNKLNENLVPDEHADENAFYSEKSQYAFTLPESLVKLYDVQRDLKTRTDKLKTVQAPENPAQAEYDGSPWTRNLLDALANVYILEPAKMDIEGNAVVLKENEDLAFMHSRFGEYKKELLAYEDASKQNANNLFCNYVSTADAAFVQQSKNDFNNANNLFQGVQIENQSVRKYPEKSLEESEKISKAIDSQIAIIRKHISLLSELTDSRLSEKTEKTLSENIASLSAIKRQSAELASLSKDQIQKSVKARNEAELRLRQAEMALEGDNFETARKRLQDSRIKFNDALALSYSDALVSESDDRLQELGEKITQKENEIVVRDVRKLKTQAKNEYYAGNFEAAENFLTQAAARWSVTNVDDDQEITSLRALVNSALSMKTGRVILPSAPLYPEMSQILSVAYQYYAEGEDFIKHGNSIEGVIKLQGALNKIKEVQLVYPLNQEASLLSLRVQKLLNPTEFDAMFSRKVTEARTNYKNPDKQQESYADLLDLYEINPKYTDRTNPKKPVALKDIIYDVELDIGIRKKPVTKVVSNKSQDLTKEAQNLFNKAKGDDEKLKKALAMLDEAISLNPDNTQAMNLKDKIQVSIGGNAAAVLTSEDEDRYQLAIQELQKNNIITANAIVEQLLQKQTNKKSTKILELQKKIKALL